MREIRPSGLAGGEDAGLVSFPTPIVILVVSSAAVDNPRNQRWYIFSAGVSWW